MEKPRRLVQVAVVELVLLEFEDDCEDLGELREASAHAALDRLLVAAGPFLLFELPAFFLDSSQSLEALGFGGSLSRFFFLVLHPQCLNLGRFFGLAPLKLFHGGDRLSKFCGLSIPPKLCTLDPGFSLCFIVFCAGASPPHLMVIKIGVSQFAGLSERMEQKWNRFVVRTRPHV